MDNIKIEKWDAAIVYTIVINSTEYMSQSGYDRKLLERERESTMHDKPDHGQDVRRQKLK